MEVSAQLHVLATYPQRKSPWYPLDRRLGGPESWSLHGGEEKNSQPLPGLEPLIIQPVAQRYTTELFWLLISDRISYKILRGLCDTTILNVRASTEDKSDDAEDSLYKELECVFNQLPK
jgi:hypothetical protein